MRQSSQKITGFLAVGGQGKTSFLTTLQRLLGWLGLEASTVASSTPMIPRFINSMNLFPRR